MMLVPEPDIPLVLAISTPGALPFKRRTTSPSGLFSKSFLPTVATAYPNAFFSLLIPRAVTTTSSISCSLFLSLAIKLPEETEIVVAENPIPETSKIAFGATLILKVPSAPVVVPVLAPLTLIEIDARGLPLSSVIFPVTSF